MIQTDECPDSGPFHSGDLLTIELFAQRIADIIFQHNYKQIQV